MKVYKVFLLFLLPVLLHQKSNAQKLMINKSIIEKKSSSITTLSINIDTTKILKPKHNPRLATKRSAILPGWGQAYNKEYWKIPIVYGALSIPTVTFFYNNTWYKRTKTAYDLLYKASIPQATQQDTLNYNNLVHEKLKGLSLGSLQTFRNSFRKDRDYSVLWFIIVWGLNVADATVFGHLKQFDVTDDLSMKIEPSVNPINHTKGIGLYFSFKKTTHKPFLTR